MSELAEQMRVVEWCRVTDWKRRQAGLPEYGIGKLFHVPNGGLRSKSEAARLKAAGVVAGVADLMVPIVKVEQGEGVFGRRVTDATGRLVCRVIAGLWVEMKADGGRLDAKQAEWGESIIAAGYLWRCCKGADEAIAAIREYAGVTDE